MLKRPGNPPRKPARRAEPEFHITCQNMSKRDSISKLHLPAIREAELRHYLAQIGASGGRTKGRAKSRGDSAYYRAIALKRWGKPATAG